RGYRTIWFSVEQYRRRVRAVSNAIDRFQRKAAVGSGLTQLGPEAHFDVFDQGFAALGSAEFGPADSQDVGNRGGHGRHPLSYPYALSIPGRYLRNRTPQSAERLG